MSVAGQIAGDRFASDFAGKELKTRATPKQARARQRVQDILTAAAQVLERHAPYDLSTTLIAEQADIPVSSIYRYFPTIEDLAEELYFHAVDDLQAQLRTLLSDESLPGWRARLVAVLDLVRAFLENHPYYRALLVLIAARRGTQSVEHAHNIRLVELLAERWGRGLDGFSGGDAKTVSTITVQMVLSLEELIANQPDPALQAAYFDELVKALEGYLAPYLGAAHEAAEPHGNRG